MQWQGRTSDTGTISCYVGSDNQLCIGFISPTDVSRVHGVCGSEHCPFRKVQIPIWNFQRLVLRTVWLDRRCNSCTVHCSAAWNFMNESEWEDLGFRGMLRCEVIYTGPPPPPVAIQSLPTNLLDIAYVIGSFLADLAFARKTMFAFRKFKAKS